MARVRRLLWACWLPGLALLLSPTHGRTVLKTVPPSGDVFPFPPKLLDLLRPRLIGPGNMGGRVVDLAVVESKPTVIYVATASGGLWKTVNNGTTWKPVF